MHFAIVNFNDAGKFLDELAARPPDVERVVRVTQVLRSTAHPPLHHLLVVAGYLRRTNGVLQLVELNTFCGQVWPGGPTHPGDDVAARAQDLVKRVEVGVRERGCGPAPGVYRLPGGKERYRHVT